jgi:AcrR family transcriptional regulator
MTRNDIINAAFSVWGGGFYKTTSLAELAKALGVSKAALYRHFPDKDALFEAMNDCFFDDYAGALKPEADKAMAANDGQEKLFIMVRAVTKYFAGNYLYFIFVLFALNKTTKPGFQFKRFLNELEKRGVNFPLSSNSEDDYPSLMFLAGMTVFFGTKLFCKDYRSPEACLAPLTEEELQSCVEFTVKKVWNGLCFDKKLIDKISFEKLESLAAGVIKSPGGDSLLKAVAEAVAEAGPRNVSMETVARLSGLSKSGLYAHFKNKNDMLARLFMTEVEQITEMAAACSGLSSLWEERLYLVIFSVTEYLKSRPEILVTLDWVRIQQLELDISAPPLFHDLFSGLTVDSDISSSDISQWVFLLIGIILMWYYHKENNLNLSNRALQKLFRFVALGVEGFLSGDGTPGDWMRNQAGTADSSGVKKVCDPV